MTDYTLTNPGARGKLGLPKELLNTSRTLLRQQDPYVIHNLSDKNIYFKPSSQKASYVLFDSTGALIMGYEGETAVMVDVAHPIYSTDRLEGASAVWLSDKVLPSGGFMLVVDDNDNKGNYYISKEDLPSGVSKTYDADGRKFLNACLMQRVGGMVKLYKGEDTPLTPLYTNQLPYILKGNIPLSTMVGVPLTDSQLKDGVEIYDDGGVFGTDTMVANDKIVLNSSSVNFGAEGDYTLTYIVTDDVESGKSATFERTLKVISAPTNQYSKYDVDGVSKYFMYGQNSSNAIRFNIVYNNANSGFGAFLYDNTASKYFVNYSPSNTETVQWTSAAVVKSDGSLVYAFNAGKGELYGVNGKIATIPVSGYNMVADMVVAINQLTNPDYSRADISDAEISKFLTESSDQTLYLIVFPNSPNTGNDSQKYGTALADAFALNSSIKLTMVCNNIKIGI